MLPLSGLRVLDFSTLLPGPMATLMLAEAGAEVIKVERPGSGEEMRHYRPAFGDASAHFAMLNRGKRSVALDLKDPAAVEALRPLLESADVLVEQFRPGVMARLGLDYAKVRAINPRIVYCSITGYGQDGPKAQVAAHDLNYQADAGLLSIAAGADGAPVVPAALIADIAGGAYPAVMNILLALRQRDRTGTGSHIDVAMTDGLLPFLFWGIGNGASEGRWPRPGGEQLSGGSPRYQIYRTADGRYLAAAPLEEKFWANFCDAIGLPPTMRDDAADPSATIAAVRTCIAGRSAAQWSETFAGKDVCCNLVKTLEEALADPLFRERRVLERSVLSADRDALPAVGVPIAEHLRDARKDLEYPRLGEGQDLLAR